MEAPLCWHCGTKHWRNEPHVFPDEPLVTKHVPDVTKLSPVTQAVTKVSKPAGRPRLYATQAEKQAAYRKRKQEQA